MPAGQNLSRFLNRGCKNLGEGPVKIGVQQNFIVIAVLVSVLRKVKPRTGFDSILGISLSNISVQ